MKQLLKDEDRTAFGRGILIRLCTLPFSLMVGGAVEGLALKVILLSCIPVFALSLLLIVGMTVFPKAAIWGFLLFAQLVRGASILGLVYNGRSEHSAR